MSDAWKHVDRFQQDCYFLLGEDSPDTNSPMLCVTQDVSTEKTCADLESQRLYLQESRPVADNASVVDTQLTEVDGNAALKERIEVFDSSQESGNFSVLALTFFTSSDSIATMYYAAPSNDFEAYVPIADEVFGTIDIEQ